MGGEDLREREREKGRERGREITRHRRRRRRRRKRATLLGGVESWAFLGFQFPKGVCFALLCFPSLLALTRRKGSEAERSGAKGVGG